MTDLITETIASMVDSTLDSALEATDTGNLDPLWDLLATAEMPWVGIAENAGGAGGEIADQVAVIEAVSAGARSVPVVETGFVAGWLAEQSGLPVDRLLTVALVPVASDDLISAQRTADGWRITARVQRVPFARHAEEFLVLAPLGGQFRAVRLDRSRCEVAFGSNLAGEPRDELIALDVPVAEGDIGSPGPLLTPAHLLARAALGRAIQSAAALRAVQTMTVRYAGQRTQFGRPIAEFQAVANHLALIAAEAEAAAAITTLAIDTWSAVGSAAGSAGGSASDSAAVTAVAAIAKARCTTAAMRANASAHQVHGAMGISAEYPLGQLTKRLWSWGADYGDERFWNRRLGRLVLDSGIGLWPAVLAVSGAGQATRST
ncbi:acyl-CoA dehydrogenase family protein [Jatrophihabitans sp. DSM 45814]